MEARVLNANASVSYRAVQDLESRQLLLDILTSKHSAAEGINPHEGSERTTISSIVSEQSLHIHACHHT